jgi:two-component system chemotaxis response regulator CheY
MNTIKNRILVVDDSATVRLYLHGLLTKWGYDVEEATTGYEGMEKALRSDYNLIIADINMPTMNGYFMVTALRKEPGQLATPIIMSSTESRECDAVHAYAAGANLFLVKPVHPTSLKQYVDFTIGEVL